MHISLTERLIHDAIIHAGEHAGKPRFKQMALLNTLIHLNPCVCLEIGTYHGSSAKIFSRYFDQHRPDGILITADVRILLTIEDPRVLQAHVYPHISNIFDHHSVKPEELLLDWEERLSGSIMANCDILRYYLRSARETVFDFAFVDGDHTETSVRKDLEIVQRLVRPPHYALFDDTHEDGHEFDRLYRECLVYEYNTYEFEEFVGLALLWEKQKGGE